MEKKIQNISIILLTILLILTSCRNSDTENHPIEGGKAVVKMNMNGTEFEKETPGLLASVNKNFNNGLQVQKNEIQLNKDLVMIAELVPETSSVQTKTASNKNNINATDIEDLPAGTPYKVAVFDASGNYVTERDYKYGQEASTPELSLDGGSQYTFIAYSASYALSLPVITFSNPSNKTLDTASLSVRGVDDVTYFRKDMVVSGNGNNYLDIVLKHKQSQITTKVDASATGYNISAISAWLSPINTNSIMQLSDGSIAESGTTGEILISNASGLNTPIVAGMPVILNTDTTTGSLVFKSITIGTITQTNLTVLNNVKVTPGVKYNLNITINPTDAYITHQGQSAVRINGQIWMRRLLGDNRATTTPEIGPFDSYNYYQFGRSTIVANASTDVKSIPGWNVSNAPNNSWNSGTEAAPVKTAADPCPTGYRVPTKTELQKLIDATTQSSVGTWYTGSSPSGDASNYSVAKIFTSRRNNAITLAFPAAGNRLDINGGLGVRGTVGYYLSSTAISTTDSGYLDVRNASVSTGNLQKIRGYNIRCVAQ